VDLVSSVAALDESLRCRRCRSKMDSILGVNDGVSFGVCFLFVARTIRKVEDARGFCDKVLRG